MRTLALLALTAATAAAQNPLRHFTDAVDTRVSRSHPVIHYTLTVSEADTTGWSVKMDLRNARDTFLIAMAKHPEYDDRFFRYVRDLRLLTPGSVAQQDSALWRVVAPGGVASIAYRIELPMPAQSPRAAWRPFLSPTGGLTGGPHAFMYVVGAELAPSHVQLVMPPAWTVATGMTPTSDPRTFFAASVYELVESPILAGKLRGWRFVIDGVPHTVAYWPLPNATPFDTASFVSGIERFARQAVQLFGRPPYREYVFQFQDGAFGGGLEHHNSVSLGAMSAELARDPYVTLPELAHEFVHTWNLMRIRPAEYVGVDYRTIQPVPTLWFSEGLTIFYADLLTRRARLPVRDSSRVAHLETLIARYLNQPGNSRFSAARISEVAYNAPPDALGDYDASSHLVGEVLGSMLDMIVRDATDGRRSMDDVMRLMLDRADARGFTNADVERAVADVCACSVKSFFDTHVRGAGQVDFHRHLALVGLRATVTREPVQRDGQPQPDFRIRAWNPPDGSLSLWVFDPASAWGRAGLHSGDRVVSMDGATPRTWLEFRQVIGSKRIGDTVRFVVRAPNAPQRTVAVTISGYDRPVVRVERVGPATAKQVRLRDAWIAGNP